MGYAPHGCSPDQVMNLMVGDSVSPPRASSGNALDVIQSVGLPAPHPSPFSPGSVELVDLLANLMDARPRRPLLGHQGPSNPTATVPLPRGPSRVGYTSFDQQFPLGFPSVLPRVRCIISRCHQHMWASGLYVVTRLLGSVRNRGLTVNHTQGGTRAQEI